MVQLQLFLDALRTNALPLSLGSKPSCVSFEMSTSALCLHAFMAAVDLLIEATRFRGEFVHGITRDLAGTASHRHLAASDCKVLNPKHCLFPCDCRATEAQGCLLKLPSCLWHSGSYYLPLAQGRQGPYTLSSHYLTPEERRHCMPLNFQPPNIHRCLGERATLPFTLIRCWSS